VLSLRVGVQAGVGMAKGTLQLRRPLGPQPTEARTVTDQQVATIDGTDEGSAPVPSIKKTERTGVTGHLGAASSPNTEAAIQPKNQVGARTATLGPCFERCLCCRSATGGLKDRRTVGRLAPSQSRPRQTGPSHHPHRCCRVYPATA